jgi:hypothetical protein
MNNFYQNKNEYSNLVDCNDCKKKYKNECVSLFNIKCMSCCNKIFVSLCKNCKITDYLYDDHICKTCDLYGVDYFSARTSTK